MCTRSVKNAPVHDNCPPLNTVADGEPFWLVGINDCFDTKGVCADSTDFAEL